VLLGDRFGALKHLHAFQHEPLLFETGNDVADL
jgi:hypothetical protein